MPPAFYEYALAFALSLPRIGGALLFAPFFKAELIGGMQARGAIVLLMGIFIYPLVSAQVHPGITVGYLFVLIVKELFLGLMLGIVPLAVFWGFQAVGNLIDNQRGATAASSLDPLVGDQSSPFGTLMLHSCIFIFFMVGGFYLYMSLIFRSYGVWPVVDFFPEFSLELVDFLARNLLYTLELCVLLAAPLVITMFLTELCMGLIGRFAPQLDVFFLSMPIKCIVAVFILLIYWQILVRSLEREMITLIEGIADLFTLV
ncbi:MAG: type III secretion system export apparatus subunit SctT [Gammaproteobacteria bacterium]|nr:type III secretion system export apparatus subunit SctT [Gammaproteobacteria bacterium]MDE0513497.1 type III secretion system export apparatus subunit SctT [Gammaproteobacteria bacterium]